MRGVGKKPSSTGGTRGNLVAVSLLVGLLVVVLIGFLVLRPSGGAGTSPRASGGTPPPGGSPNVILIVTDDQRWDSLFAMPNVRRLLMEKGVTRTNDFVTPSYC